MPPPEKKLNTHIQDFGTHLPSMATTTPNTKKTSRPPRKVDTVPDAESSDTVVTPPTGIIGKESVKTGTIMRYMMVNATSYRYLSLA